MPCCSVNLVDWLCPTLCEPMDCSMPGFPVHHHLLSLLKLTFIKLVMPSNHLVLWCPLLLLPSIFPSIRVFSNEYSGLISLRIEWFDLLGVQGTLKSLVQLQKFKKRFNFSSSKPSILWCSAFFMAQLSHPYMTTGKTIVLTIQNFVGKVLSLLFNMLSLS